jgi:hypothetical protein
MPISAAILLHPGKLTKSKNRTTGKNEHSIIKEEEEKINILISKK